MNRMIIFLGAFIFYMALTGLTYAWNDTHTHPELITERAIGHSEAIVNPSGTSFVKKQLGFYDGKYHHLRTSGSSFETKTISGLIKEGAELEDSPNCRASNHFHNPLAPTWADGALTDNVSALDEICYKTDPEFYDNYSNLLWATGLSEFGPLSYNLNDINDIDTKWNGRNWNVARHFYYKALTSNNVDLARESYFAQTFLTLGYILHLLQDVGVPAHTRNDFSKGHLVLKELPYVIQAIKNLDITKAFGNPFENYVQYHYEEFESYIKNTVPVHFEGEKNLTNFWDTDKYNPGDVPTKAKDIGLAEYSNGNFLSYATIFRPVTDTKHYFSYPATTSTIDNLKNITAKDGKIDQSLYLDKINDGEQITNFLAYRFLARDIEEIGIPDHDKYLVYYFNDIVYESYAKKIIPRAIGYSANLIDYFFRGILEITAPDQFVYSIIDGGKIDSDDPATQYYTDDGIGIINTQVFKTIKAKIRNISPKETGATGNITTYETIGKGSLVAVARYKRRNDYLPDLSNDPPLFESNEIYYSYSISAPIEIDKLSTDATEEYIFDFTENPIPASITDLTLQVVFKGVLGVEQDGVAVGMVDLNEPEHLTFINSTDYVRIDNNLYTESEIINDPILSDYVDFNNNGILNEKSVNIPNSNETVDEPYISPYQISYDLAFSAVDPELPNTPPLYLAAKIENLPAGHFSRLIILTDRSNVSEPTGPSTGWLMFNRHAPGLSTNISTNYYSFQSYPAQEYADGWKTQKLFPESETDFRGVRQHHLINENYCWVGDIEMLVSGQNCTTIDKLWISYGSILSYEPHPIKILF